MLKPLTRAFFVYMFVRLCVCVCVCVCMFVAWLLARAMWFCAHLPDQCCHCLELGCPLLHLTGEQLYMYACLCVYVFVCLLHVCLHMQCGCVRTCLTSVATGCSLDAHCYI